jgi:squalene synthase HpnC
VDGQSAAVSIEHYENFPVASVLCPAALRPAVLAIYRFARTADDIADEGDGTAEARLSDLRHFHTDLDAVFRDAAPSARWRQVFEPLAAERRRHALPYEPLADLLSAFAQDTCNPLYETRAQLLDYCARSANPVGRLLLHLYGLRDATSLAQADSICTSLQLINFWQDCSVDLPRGRIYLPAEDASKHGVSLSNPATLVDSAATRALLSDLCHWARSLMLGGAPLATRLHGRAGWELRLVVQGGLRILEKIERMGHSTIQQRPILTVADVPVLLWRAWRMDAATKGGR